MAKPNHPVLGVLLIGRFCGPEEYPVVSATWNVHHDINSGMPNLVFFIETERGTILNDDTQALDGKPHWQINCVNAINEVEDIVVGLVVNEPDGYDEDRGGHLTNFYYCQHVTSEKNQIQIIAIEGERIFARVTGEVIDVNYYDDSKPRSTLFVETWFERSQDTLRSVC